MDTISAIFFPGLLILASVVLMASHMRAWREYQNARLSPEDLEFRRRQFSRRMQTSAMLVVLAIALFIGYVLTQWLDSGWFILIYWIAVMGLVGWLVMLAALDIWATHYHFGRQRHLCAVEQARLQAECRHIQSTQGNGHSTHKNPIPPPDNNI